MYFVLTVDYRETCLYILLTKKWLGTRQTGTIQDTIDSESSPCLWRDAVPIDQASFDHVKVGTTPILPLDNLLRNLHTFPDILEFRVLKKNVEKAFLIILSQICEKMA